MAISVRVLLLRAAGTNCDGETEFAFRQAGADVVEKLHTDRLAAQPERLSEFAILALPGGFSFGDDVGAGRIWAEQLTRRVGDALRRFVDRGGLVIGICNGFQALVKAGLLPNGTASTSGSSAGAVTATLAWNANARFQDRWVQVVGGSSRCVWLSTGVRMALPVAHGEGRFLPAEASLPDRLTTAGQIALRYCDEAGRPADGGPANPNGSVADIAGLCDPTGRIFGLMPHPERHIVATQHPRWTRLNRPADGEGDGLQVFRNAVRAARG